MAHPAWSCDYLAMRIREAKIADASLVLTMRLAFLADHRRTTPDEFSSEFVTATERFVTEQLRLGMMRSWFAETDSDECVGVVSVLLLDMAPRPEDLRTKEGYVINMYVAPEARGQGIGRHLATACQEFANAAGVRRLLLHATDDGMPLYRSVGFAPNDRWMELPVPAV